VSLERLLLSGYPSQQMTNPEGGVSGVVRGLRGQQMLTDTPGHLWRDKWTALSGPLSGFHHLAPEVQKTTKGPMWGHPRPVLGAVDPFLEPFCGHLLLKVDRLCSKLTFEIPPRRALRGVRPHS